MTLIQIIVLALIQGLTEFLPISSSAHLILGDRLFGWPEQGLTFDVATHFGTLVAALVYFRREIIRMATACVHAPLDERQLRDRRMAWLLAAASLPVLLAGFLASGLVSAHLRDVRVIAWATLVFGLLLWWADARGARNTDLEGVRWKQALAIGLAQMLSLIPGVSRSGITITAGRFLGLNAHAAARFSFLLSIPVIAAAGAYGAWRVGSGAARIDWVAFSLGAGFSALTGWICIAAFLALIKRIGLMPFVIYRLFLGVALIALTW